MKSSLLTVFDDMESMAILIALFHWNPKTLHDVVDGVGINMNVAKEKLQCLTSMGFVDSEEDNYEISDFGKIFVTSLGIDKETLNRDIGPAPSQ